MQKTTSASVTPLRRELELLSAFTPTEFPVLSLYLDLSSNDRGREHYAPFLRKAFAEEARAFAPRSEQRISFDADAERISEHLAAEVPTWMNGLAVFACHGADGFFHTVSSEAQFPEHALYVDSVPHVSPLARLVEQYPRYAAVLLDTYQFRIFVFSLGAVEQSAGAVGVKTRRQYQGGWSQARYQRHVENFQLHNIKHAVEALERIVAAEHIDRVVVSGNEVAAPLFMDQLPGHLLEKLVDVLRLPARTADREALDATLATIRRKDTEADTARARELLDAWQSHGLGVVGAKDTLLALTMGQVDELLIASRPDGLAADVPSELEISPDRLSVTTSSPAGPPDRHALHVADELVAKAELTGARVRFIEDPALLAPAGGVGALLRFRV